MVTVSTTLNKPDATTKLNGQFRVCEAEDEELTAIVALIDNESNEGTDDSLYIHCLFRKEIFSLYALIKVSVEQSDLFLSREDMFGFPVYASRLVSDPLSQMIVAYNADQCFEAENADELKDYYFVGSPETSSEVILMGADTRLGEEAG